jgi:hypothetical protein
MARFDFLLTMGLREDDVYMPSMPNSIEVLNILILRVPHQVDESMLSRIWINWTIRCKMCGVMKGSLIESVETAY